MILSQEGSTIATDTSTIFGDLPTTTYCHNAPGSLIIFGVGKSPPRRGARRAGWVRSTQPTKQSCSITYGTLRDRMLKSD